MGEHQTWFDFLDNIPAWRSLTHSLEGALGRTWEFAMFGPTHFSLIHVLFALVCAGFILYGAFRFHAAYANGTGTKALIPPARLSLRNIFEMICDAVFSLMAGMMGEKHAKKFFPLIGSFAFFILFSNLMALIPGFGVPTATLKTNLCLGLIVFFVTHYYGVKVHGIAYFKHFLGPLPWLAPLMLPIELISHLVRPASLALRLMGNMVGDHKVVFSFFTLVPLLLPVPFLVLGILVSIVQTVVFCLLSVVYISTAIAEDH